MYQRFIVVAVIALISSGSTAFAQCGCSSQPVYAPVASGYASYYAPQAAYYSPVSYTSYYAPPVAYAPAPYVSYYAGKPYVTYYSPYATYAPFRALPGLLLRRAGPEHVRGTPRLRAG